MTEQTPTSPPGLPPDPFDGLARFSREVAYVLIALGAIAFGGTIFVGLRLGSDNTLFVIWAGALALIFLSFGVYSFTRISQPAGALAPATWQRLQTAIVGGLVGFATALLGLVLPFTEPYKSVFTSGLTEWRQHPGYLFLVGGSLFGGLLLMFLSLQFTRPFERTRADLRRLVYGFNSVLSILLLFIVLGLVNALGYSNVAPFSALAKSTDWTASQIYTPKESTINILRALDRPVKFYLLINTRDRQAQFALGEIQKVLDNFQRVSDKVSYEIVSPHVDSRRLDQLDKDYTLPQPLEYGILVVYGDESHAPSEYVKLADLFVPTSENKPPVFRGEGVLARALDYLKTGKAVTKIYVTQGNGEPSLKSRAERGLNTLVTALGSVNMELLPLDLTGAAPAVPEDATVVVLAGPRRKLSVAAVDALTRYYQGGPAARKKGKLFIMLDPVMDGEKMLETGLEKLVAEQGVEVVKDRAQTPDPANPTRIVAVGDDNSSNALAQTFSQEPVVLTNCRSTKTSPPADPSQRLKVEVLLVPAAVVWSETRLDGDPSEQARELNKSLDALTKRMREHPVTSLALTVADASGPRMVVIGDSTWITEKGLDNRYKGNNLSLFRSSVNWLRGSPDLGTTSITGKAVETYSLDITDDAMTRLEFLPGVLMILGVVALGASVWVVRRR